MNNWTLDYSEFKIYTLPLLQQYGKDIGKKAQEKNDLCKRIISNYELLYKSYDPVTHILIKIDLDKYLND